MKEARLGNIRNACNISVAKHMRKHLLGSLTSRGITLRYIFERKAMRY
jgi:hypothetical protein